MKLISFKEMDPSRSYGYYHISSLNHMCVFVRVNGVHI